MELLWQLLALLSVFFSSTFATSHARAAFADEAISLTSLQVESKDAPLGIDVIPRFSWIIRSSERDVSQTSYQIRVSSISSGADDAWNSGVMNYSQPYGIEYAGNALQSDTFYHWTVTVTTNAGSATANSTFATGFLSTSDWGSSVWIGSGNSTTGDNLSITNSSWIWTSEGGSGGAPAGVRPFRKTFTTPTDKIAISADVIITVDDGFEFYINGDFIGASPDSLDIWKSAQRYTVSLQSSSNLFAVNATNLVDRNAGGESPAGVLIAIQVNYADGSFDTVLSDTTWLALPSSPPDGFEQPSFNDSSWVYASSSGIYGISPWNTDVSVPTVQASATPDITIADWIWTNEMSSASASAPAGSRPFRRTFITPNGKTATVANLIVTVDDEFDLYINGGLVGSSPENVANSWEAAQPFQMALNASSNVFAILATNLNDPTTGDETPAGVLVSIIITYSDGTTDSLVSDSSWLTIPSSPPSGFEQPSFDDSSWANSTSLGLYGAGEWGTGVTVSDPLGEHPAPLLRKEFSVSKSLAWARLYYSAGGYAHITLNGQPISDHVLTPGFTKYDTSVQSVTIDVKLLLVQGTNALGVELGRSHYGVTQPDTWSWNEAPWHADPALRLVLSIGYTDGTTSEVISDASWAFIEGPTRLDDVFGGENYDARYRASVAGYDEAGFNDSAWKPVLVVSGPAGTIYNQLQVPTRIVQTLTPVNITQPAPDIFVVAFERNVAGWVQISVQGPAGTLVTIHFGEKLNDDGTVAYADIGNYYANNFQTDRFWLAGTGEPETFEPKFSWKGYQFVQLEGWPSGSSPQISDIVGKVVHDNFASYGNFESSNDLLNQLHRASVYTMLNNAHSYPEDCPTYEKNGWSGDAMSSAEGFLSNLDTQQFLAQYVRNLDESKLLGNGPPGVIAPDDGWGANNHAPTWHSAFILIPQWLHMYRGDLRTLQTHYDSMKAYVEFELGRSPGNIATTSLGDWDTPETSPLGGNPPDNSSVEATAFLYKMLTTMQGFAVLLNETSDATTFGEQATAVKDAFNSNFYDSNLGYYFAVGDIGYRQTHNLLALAFGLADSSIQQAVADSIALNATALGTHLNTGALGTKHLLPVLTQWGHADVAFGLATQTTYPSWGFWIANGATTMWEHWLVAARSHDHHFLGTFEDWLYQYVAGIQATGTAFQTVTIAPALTSYLTSASAWMLTPYGNISSSWTSDMNGSLLLDVNIPVGVSGTIILPASSSVNITENGIAIADSQDITVASQNSTSTTLIVGSGQYSFAM